MRSSVATNALAAKAFLDCLRNAARTATTARRAGAIRAEAERMMLHAREELIGPDLDGLEAAYSRFGRDLSVYVAEKSASMRDEGERAD